MLDRREILNIFEKNNFNPEQADGLADHIVTALADDKNDEFGVVADLLRTAIYPEGMIPLSDEEVLGLAGYIIEFNLVHCPPEPEPAPKPQPAPQPASKPQPASQPAPKLEPKQDPVQEEEDLDRPWWYWFVILAIVILMAIGAWMVFFSGDSASKVITPVEEVTDVVEEAPDASSSIEVDVVKTEEPTVVESIKPDTSSEPTNPEVLDPKSVEDCLHFGDLGEDVSPYACCLELDAGIQTRCRMAVRKAIKEADSL